MNALALAEPIEPLTKRELEAVENTLPTADDELALARWEDDGGAISRVDRKATRGCRAQTTGDDEQSKHHAAMQEADGKSSATAPRYAGIP